MIKHRLVKHVRSKSRERVYECKGEEECEYVCRKKANCPHKRIIGQVFKNMHIVEKNGKGKGLVLGESCNKDDFVIPYFIRAVSATKLKKYGGIGMYFIKLGQKECLIVQITVNLFLSNHLIIS